MSDDGWADDVDYGDDDDEMDVDYGDDDELDGIGDLDLSDDDDMPDGDLPQTGNAMGVQEFKTEISSTLENPYKIGVSYTLEFDTKDTPANISDDDESAVGLRINHFKLMSVNDDNKEDDDTLLGSGAFAKVFRARNTRNGKTVALKCMYKNLLRKQFVMKSRYDLKSEDDTPITIRHTMLDAVQIELQIMMKVRHVNIIKLFYVIDDPRKDSLYLAIEYSPYGQVMDFDGKILQYIPNKKIMPQNKYITSDLNAPKPWWYAKYVEKDEQKQNNICERIDRFNEGIARKLFMDCVKGVSYLHDLNMIHRDLKPENLLLFKDGNHDSGLMVKIADFGTAEQFSDKSEAILIDTQGTYHFMSPSAIGGDKRNAFYDDTWALGIVLYAFIYGTVPFFHPLDYQLFESIQNDELILPANDALSASEQVRDLIGKLLVKEDEQRISLTEIEAHAWFADNNYVHPEYVMEEDEDIDMYEQREDDTCCVVL